MVCTILHADDVQRWRDLVEDTLSPEFEVVSVNNCDEVMPRLREGGIDLVLLDLLMPGSDDVDTGYEVLQSVRRQYPDLPVCMFTGGAIGSKLERSELESEWNVPIVFKDDFDAVEQLKSKVRELGRNPV